MGEVILEAKRPGDASWTKLDVDQTALATLEKSLFDAFDISKLKTEVSKTIKIPVIGNRDFFGDFHNVDNPGYPRINLYGKIEARLKWRTLYVNPSSTHTCIAGILYFIGYSHLDYTYNIQIAGTLGNIKSRLGTLTCAEVSNIDDWDHELNTANVISSWTDGIKGGDVHYPISDNGIGYDYYTDVEKVDPFNQGNRPNSKDKDVYDPTNPAYPIKTYDLRPAINIESMAIQCLEDAGYVISKDYESESLQKRSLIQDTMMLLKTPDDAASYDEGNGIGNGGFGLYSGTGNIEPNESELIQYRDISVDGTVSMTNSDRTILATAGGVSTFSFTFYLERTEILSPSPLHHIKIKTAGKTFFINWDDLNWYRSSYSPDLWKSYPVSYIFDTTDVAISVEIENVSTSSIIDVVGSWSIRNVSSDFVNSRSIVKALNELSQIDLVSNFLKYFKLFGITSTVDNSLTLTTYNRLKINGTLLDISDKIDYISEYEQLSLTDLIPTFYLYNYEKHDSYINEKAKELYKGLDLGALKINVELTTRASESEYKALFSPACIASSEHVDRTIIRNFKNVTKIAPGDQGYNIYFKRGTKTVPTYYIEGTTSADKVTQTVWPFISTVDVYGSSCLFRGNSGSEVNIPEITDDVFSLCHRDTFDDWFGLKYYVGGEALIAESEIQEARIIVCAVWLTQEEYESISFGDTITVTNNYGTTQRYRLLDIKSFDITLRTPCKMRLIKIV